MITVIMDRIASQWSLLKLLIQHESKVSWVYLWATRQVTQ